MPAWDAQDCVNQFRAEAGLPAVTTGFIDSDIAELLSRAQAEVVADIASRYANCLYNAPVAITSTDGGKTFTFGTDAQGQPIVPMGWVEVAPNLSAFTGLEQFVGWVEGRDFMDEGAHIRIPSNRAYTGTLYARFVSTPPDIVLGPPAVNPILNPPHTRRLIVRKAVADWALQGNARPDLAVVKQGQYTVGFRSAMTMYKTRYKNGGGLLDPARWYFAAPDLGTTG